jgi:molybdate transport system substrate-binding protein
MFHCVSLRAAFISGLAVLLSACAAAPAAPPTVTVFAAASLADALATISADFTAQSGIAVVISSAGSQELVTQLNEGAPVDVLATASLQTMDTAVAGGRIAADAVRPFAANRLALVVNNDARDEISGLVDLAGAGRSVVLADQAVPAGGYARALLAAADRDPRYGSDFAVRVLANVVSFETNVRAVLNRVELGEADAGIVYRTDAFNAAESVTLRELPEQFNPPVVYPLAVVADSRAAAAAEQFAAYVLSPAGQAVLADYGFLPPEP